jgi:PAS domain S-box-containing protein
MYDSRTSEKMITHELFSDTDFLKAVFDTITDGVVVMDGDGLILACNRHALELTGATEHQFIGRNAYGKVVVYREDGELFPVEELPGYITCKTGQPQEQAIMALEKVGGGLVWLSVSSSLIHLGAKRYVFTISRDITLRKRSEDKLKLSEQKFSNAFNFSGTGTALISVAGEWLDVNPALCSMLGYTREELLNSTFQEITCEEDLPAEELLMKQALEGTRDSYSLEKRYTHKEGGTLWVSLNGSLVKRADGSPKFFIAHITDITPAKSLNKELEKNNRTLEVITSDLARSVRQLEEFNRIVAHNLRGPAANIRMILEMLMESDSEVQREEYMQLLQQSSNNLNGTLEELMQILDVRLNKEIPYDDCVLEKTIESISQQLQVDIKRKRATIIPDLAVPVIPYPHIYMESIFYNLISNSLKYAQEGVPPVIRISSYREGRKDCIRIADNGIGIDLEKYGSQVFKLHKIFHKGYDSRGVGLFLIKNQVETLGGTISVESRPGEGTAFTIRF